MDHLTIPTDLRRYARARKPDESDGGSDIWKRWTLRTMADDWAIKLHVSKPISPWMRVRVEGLLLGFGMSMAAWLLERMVLRSTEHLGAAGNEN